MVLCREAALLANTLEGLAKTIRTGLEQYPVGSSYRVEAQERVSGSGSRLHGRVEKLVKCVCNHGSSVTAYFIVIVAIFVRYALRQTC